MNHPGGPTDQEPHEFKAQVERATSRKGERPTDLKSPVEMIKVHMIQALGIQLGRTKSAELQKLTSIIVLWEAYAPSVAPLDGLKKIHIRELQLETHHQGFFMILKFAGPAIRMSNVINIVEDEKGDVVQFYLCHQDPETTRPAEDILRQDSIIILKEPYFRVDVVGEYVIRVDHPTDIIWLADDDLKIPPKWRSKTAMKGKSADHWKTKGNDMIRLGKFHDAITFYSKALRSSPTIAEVETIRNNRALAYLRIGAYDAVLDDVKFVPDAGKRSEKSLYREAQALYNLGRFQDCASTLQTLVTKFPKNEAGRREMSRVQIRLVEQDTGIYDFIQMYKETKLRPPLLDFATFKGPIEIRMTEASGRGLFTTKAVQVGELLLCEKAFAFQFQPPPDEMVSNSAESMSQSSALIDLSTNETISGPHGDMISQISTKLQLNPSLISQFRELHHRDYKSVSAVTVDGFPVVDTFLIWKIIHSNSFAATLTTKEIMSDDRYVHNRKTMGKPQVKCSTGIWLTASYINHSCITNCQRTFIGDMQIIRASDNIPAGTELNFSYVSGGPEELRKRLSKGWGFRCECPVCVDDRETSTEIKTQREKWSEEFFATPDRDLKKKEDIIKAIEKTYRYPASKVPRDDLWDLKNTIPSLLVAQNTTEPWRIVERLLSTLESIGFVIEGGLVGDKMIKVKKWGGARFGCLTILMSLRAVYRTWGLLEMAEQAEELARITYLVQIGEDATFSSDLLNKADNMSH